MHPVPEAFCPAGTLAAPRENPDLLIRHERLSHDKNGFKRKYAKDKADSSDDFKQPPRVRITSIRDGDSQETTSDGRSNSPTVTPFAVGMLARATIPMDTSFHSPLAALSFAAEQSAFRDALAASSTQASRVTPGMNSEPVVQANSLPTSAAAPLADQDIPAALDDEPLESYRFSSTVTAEQPVPLFSPEPVLNPTEYETPHAHPVFSQSRSLDESTSPRPLSNISNMDRQDILSRMAEFVSVVPSGFRLPSRLALSRYIGAYIASFHPHLPFLHIPTMTVENTCVELLLALAAVGAQHCFEEEKGIELFHTARAIAAQRITRRDVGLANPDKDSLWAMSESTRSSSTDGADLMQTAQALLVLMATATWARRKEILREALAIQSILATLVRDDGLHSSPYPPDITWEEWAQQESRLRTKFIVFCFFNLHCIVYNIPPLILNLELKMQLPSSAAEFEATSAASWDAVRKRTAATASTPPTTDSFQSALRRLFSPSNRDISTSTPSSPLSNHILIHALHQHIFFARQTAPPSSPSSLPTTTTTTPTESDALPPSTASTLTHALRTWQRHASPSSNAPSPSISSPPSPPTIPFANTALLRLAHTRLHTDTSPAARAALASRDPRAVARALREWRGPPLSSSSSSSSSSSLSSLSKMTAGSMSTVPPVVRHSVRALGAVVEAAGLPVAATVGRAPVAAWGVEYWVVEMECAVLLGKWLEGVAGEADQGAGVPGGGGGGGKEEGVAQQERRRVVGVVRGLLEETEFAVEGGGEEEGEEGEGGIGAEVARRLGAGVLRVWAGVFGAAQTWPVVGVMGCSLGIYADMMELGQVD
ncbi:regulatory protein [Diplodia corticola]|uniref:Regulatory protein n=1 Tax=Diplodia corticola TaxID=236234 RepID=A0A1J9RCY0_9PEZI|nr:regulatory protein [Diplodia corticola]OJD30371.1 regulatory protein [Diplodia corticola]